MLASLLPMFNGDMSVKAYCLFAQKENMFNNPQLLGTGRLDGVGNIAGIEVIENISIDTLAPGCFISVPVNNISLFADIRGQFKGQAERIILLVDPSVKPEPDYIKRVIELKKCGFKFAMKKMRVELIENYKPLLELFDVMVINCKYADPVKQAMYYSHYLPNMYFSAENISSFEQFVELKNSGYFETYEGDFFRVPKTKEDTEFSPIKTNYLNLLNVINHPDFDLTKAADVIAKDPALTLSLLNVVNKLTLNSNISSIKQATALLGQKELKKWINTAVTKQLCADRPNEVTRVSLLRAKFAENLAKTFEMAGLSSELFLMGLFSILDIILEKPMEEALSIVNVSKGIKDALVEHEGEMAKVYDFIVAYELANWTEVSRQMVLFDLDESVVYDAYIDSLKWYRELFGDAEK